MLPLKILDRCNDRIPIEYEGKTHFIDPITRQPFPFANEIRRKGTYGNTFQLDIDVATSWYKLSPVPEPVNAPLIFEPTEIGHITEPEEYNLQRSGLYSPAQVKDFWDKVIQNSAYSILKKLTRRILTNGNNVRIMESGNLDQALSFNNRMYFDSFLSPDYFTQQFKSAFGSVFYYLEKRGIWFAVFLFLKLNGICCRFPGSF